MRRKRTPQLGDIVQVLWLDAQFAWDETPDTTEGACYTVGHLLTISPKSLELAMEIGSEGIAGKARARFLIPRSLVKKISILKRGRKA